MYIEDDVQLTNEQIRARAVLELEKQLLPILETQTMRMQRALGISREEVIGAIYVEEIGE